MWKRTVFVPALAFAVGACGACGAVAAAAQPVAGTGDVRVIAVRFVPGGSSGVGLAAAGVTYVVATVALSNETAHDFTPDVSRFVLTSATNVRYTGSDSGSPAVAGLANAHKPLKAGETRRYTVAFRTADPVLAGTISYEP